MEPIRFLNLRYIFERLYELLVGLRDGSTLEGFLIFWNSILPAIKTFSTYLSLIFLTLGVYSFIRYKQVKEEEKEKFKNYYEAPEEGAGPPKNERWEKILAMTESNNPNDWRQAIIESDVILDEIVSAQGYKGESLGEKLKSVELSDFNSLNSAWEAHKIRNRIAHDGSAYNLTERETKRTINLFAEVFHEFSWI